MRLGLVKARYRYIKICKSKIFYVGYVPNVGIFVLFQVTESKDVFGIGIAETKNQDRQIIQFGFDKSDNYYKFIFGGED